MLEQLNENEFGLKSSEQIGNSIDQEQERSSRNLLYDDVETLPQQERHERKEGQVEKDSTYNQILAKAKNPGSIIHGDVFADAEIANRAIDYENKISTLIGIAREKGVAHAVKVARHLDDNYLLDELHDRLLATDLHNALLKEGMIVEV